jgi:general secretion pathway protein G
MVSDGKIKFTKLKGFTLLELLVVVAIIGLLATVVMFSIRDSKTKGADAAIKSAMDQAKNQAELYFNNNNRSYEGLCANDPFNKNTIGRFLIAAQGTYGAPVNGPYIDGTAGSFSPIREVCHDSTTAYAAWIPLAFSSNNAWCIDSINNSKSTNAVLPANQMFCP